MKTWQASITIEEEGITVTIEIDVEARGKASAVKKMLAVLKGFGKWTAEDIEGSVEEAY